MLTASIIDFKENAQRELMEKKRAEREKQKLEKEGKKQQQQGNVSEAGSKLKKPDEDEDIIGALMKEIRRGKTLCRRSESQPGRGSRPSRSGAELKQDDIIRLQKIYEENILEQTKDAPTTQPKVVLQTGEVDGGHAAAEKTATAESQLLAAKQYRKDRSRSEAFAGLQYSKRGQIRHSFHNMPHYETTV